MQRSARESTSYAMGMRLTGFQVYDNLTAQPVYSPKSYCRPLKASELPDAIARFFPVAADGEAGGSNTGLPRATLLAILRGLREDVAEIRDVVAEVEVRLVGASLLVIYEADWARAEEGVKMMEEEESDEGDKDEDEDESDEDESDEGRPGPPYVVKLIDFAHSRITPGQGPDEGVLLGLNSLLKLLDGRIGQVRK